MPNHLITLSGTIGTAEEFSHTLAASTVAMTSETVNGIAHQAFALAYAQNVTGFRNAMSLSVAWRDCATAPIINPATGELGAAFHEAYVEPGLAGSGGSAAFQVAGCVSLTAGTRPNGQPLRGRFYLPTVSNLAVANGRFQSTTVSGIADTIGYFLGELIDNGVTPCVWSRTLAVLQPVTAARFGDVPDTIRSRRNGLTEVYEPISITPVP